MNLDPHAASPVQPKRVSAAHSGAGDWHRLIIANSGIAIGYLVLRLVTTFVFAAYGKFPAPIWLPTAVAVVAAMAGGARLAPGIFVGSFLTNAFVLAPPLHVTAIVSVSSTLGPVLGAMLLRRYRSESGTFTSLAGVIRFLACMMLLSPAITATGGAIAMGLGHPFDLGATYATWVGWWLCDAGGTLYLAPALLFWLGIERAADPAGDEQREHDHGLIILPAIAAFTIVLFLSPPLPGNAIRQVFPFLLVVPLAWVAVRMSLRTAFTLISLIALIAATGTLAGFGVFCDQPFINPLQMVTTLVILLAMDVLTTVALVSELYNAKRENHVKSMFLATTSHELRSPLNAILGFSSLIGGKVPIAAEKYGDYGQLIHAAGEHLLGLINGLLDLSKIEAGRFPLSEEPLVVGEVIQEAVALCRMQAEAKAVALSVAITEDVQGIYADPKALRQILLNLISNGVKFTPAGGRVDLVICNAENGDLIVSIRDTGVGIPAEGLERVFTPFERLHRSDLPDVEGTGLGLSITRGLVVLHGGAIRLESEPGVGTTAIVTLPASRVIGFSQSQVARLDAAA